MRTPWFFLPLLLTASLLSAQSDHTWIARMGRGDGGFEAQGFRVTVQPAATGSKVQTDLPAHGTLESRVTVELDSSGRLIRSRTEYKTAALTEWYRADLLFTEVQQGAGPGGADNLAFQRAWRNEVQEAKNLAWGPDFVEFSTLPFLLEKKLAASVAGWSFRTYSQDTPGTMEVRVLKTNRPLDVETRYAYPRWLREHFANRRVLLVELNGVGDFKGAYPYPFFYAFTVGPKPEWIAAWGGNPKTPSFQWRE